MDYYSFANCTLTCFYQNRIKKMEEEAEGTPRMKEEEEEEAFLSFRDERASDDSKENIFYEKKSTGPEQKPKENGRESKRKVEEEQWPPTRIPLEPVLEDNHPLISFRGETKKESPFIVGPSVETNYREKGKQTTQGSLGGEGETAKREREAKSKGRMSRNSSKVFSEVSFSEEGHEMIEKDKEKTNPGFFLVSQRDEMDKRTKEKTSKEPSRLNESQFKKKDQKCRSFNQQMSFSDYVHSRLEEMIEELVGKLIEHSPNFLKLFERSEGDGPVLRKNVETAKKQIVGIVARKCKFMLFALKKNKMDKWFETLVIRDNFETEQNAFIELRSVFLEAKLLFSSGEDPTEETMHVCNRLLGSPKLIPRIASLILNYESLESLF